MVMKTVIAKVIFIKQILHCKFHGSWALSLSSVFYWIGIYPFKCQPSTMEAPGQYMKSVQS